MDKCEYNKEGKYRYPNGTCMNKDKDIDNHFNECNQERCGYEGVQMVQESDTFESKDV